jgi:hypothetical protein
LLIDYSWGGTATNLPSATMDTIGFFGGATGYETILILHQYSWLKIMFSVFLADAASAPKVTGSPGFTNLTVFNTTSKVILDTFCKEDAYQR